MLKDESLAYEVLKISICPIFENQSKFNKLRSYDSKNTAKSLSSLVEAVCSFKNYDIEEHLEKFKESFLEFLKDEKLIRGHEDLLEKILDMFSNNSSMYSSSAIKKLFEYRLNILSAKVGEPPKVGWSMPGTIVGHPILNDFLQSEQNEIIYRGFTNLREAREFADRHRFFNSSQSFSFNVSVKGSGAQLHVTIVKTKDYYENENEKFRTRMNEYMKLKKFVNDTK